MKKIEQALQPINGYLILIERDTVNGWYQLKIGLPSSWVFDENDKITCEVVNENDEGKIIIISPKVKEVVIDDLIGFVGLIITTNKKIAQKEKEFNLKMENFKKDLEEQAKTFYDELDDLKSDSFKNFNDSNNNQTNSKEVKESKNIKKIVKKEDN